MILNGSRLLMLYSGSKREVMLTSRLEGKRVLLSGMAAFRAASHETGGTGEQADNCQPKIR